MKNVPLRYRVEHTVRSGETLRKLAKRYSGDDCRWKDIYNATDVHRKLLGQGSFNPNNMSVGMVVVVPYPTQGVD